MKAAGNIQLHIAPLVPIGVDSRQKPLEAAMTLNGHNNASGLAPSQSLQVDLGIVQPR